MQRPTASAALKAQHDYAAKKSREKTACSITVGEAFVRGMRDLGYKSTGDALNELVDNSAEAAASKVLIGFGYGKSDSKPESLYVADNGHGMEPEMLRLAVTWGGTHRENSRSGYGRYGFGLPSACVSVARRFTVFSKTKGRDFYAVTIDLDDIAKGKYTQPDGLVIVPEAKRAKPPDYVKDELDTLGSTPHGTIVLLEKLDKLDYKIGSRLQAHLIQKIGITYRNILRDVAIQINDVVVEPIDPLFLRSDARYYDLDEDRSEPLPPATITVKESDHGPGGIIRVRYSYLPPTFQRKHKKSNSSAASGMNERFQVMKDNNGFVICRAGRQIDVVTKNPKTTFMTNDRNHKVEVDFEPTLDEEFGVSTSKQQITPSERIWNILIENRVFAALEEMREKAKHDRSALSSSEGADSSHKRPSETAMEQADKILKRSAAVESLEKEIAAQRNLDREIRDRAKASQLPLSVVEENVKKEVAEHKFRIRREASPEGPFYRVEQVGGQSVVYLNTAHRFFTDLYAGPNSSPAVRNALEVMFFVLGSSEIGANEEYQKFYRRERPEWSRALDVALGELEIVAGSSELEEDHAEAGT